MELGGARRYRGSNALGHFLLSLEAVSPAAMNDAPAARDRDE
jgi:hypothetical protein